ncbi:Alpha/Beta hydrolase protein [Mycena olivaceomarginata]|nr:Alpha/Beta hydrolase protein [Mycena olivaceomarginata]
MFARYQILIVAATILSTSAQSTPIVDLGYAQYQGAVSAANISHFLGIRYAAAPLGDLRFRGPQPPANVTGVQQATVQPNQCFQASNGLSSTNPLETRAAQVISTEDCLFLNVFYPSDASGTPIGKLAVLVYIHGGGYLAGQASAYNGEDVINQSNRGLVVVTIQYRLGVFGFLPGAKVKANGALNAGLLDQDFALRWINRNINKFGGDPSKVTIWGESAGAGSVLQQVVANGGKTKPQLFRGAITSSTFLPSQYNYNDRVPELLFSEVVAQVNCSAAGDTLGCLRAADINNGGFFGTFLFVPVVDGTFITQRPTLSLQQSKVNGEALLSVTNTFEGTIFVDQNTAATANATQYALNLFPGFRAAQADKVGQLYAGLGTALFQENAIQGESIFVCPTYAILQAFKGRAFKAEFAVPPGLHANDIAYYWPSLSTPPFQNTNFINAFAQTFTSFALSLDPNVKVSQTITPPWAKWNVGNTEMNFNQTNGVPVIRPVTTDAALLERLWAGLTAQ